MKIGLLTSSRADFGIYLPLIREIKMDPCLELKIIAFGTHLSYFHGYTINNITDNGFEVAYTVESLLLSDSPRSVAAAMGLTMIEFSSFWKDHRFEFDIVFCLGDRYEMYAAVMSATPFQINFAHIHGGETTLGAIDNIYRHGITLASKYHFVSTEAYKKRVEEITGSNKYIYNTGALGLDNLNQIKFFTIDEFKQQWNINLGIPTILVTFHPETVVFEKNAHYINELINALQQLHNYQVLITMPNADTNGNIIRKVLIEKFSSSTNVYLVENLGMRGYFTAMRYCAFLLGNTSSGIIEAASLGKYVINLGDRQKGRIAGNNVIHIPVECSKILAAVSSIENAANWDGSNIYFAGGTAAKQIINTLKHTWNDGV